jgi:GT2 family glycosyltransferase/glycosyltransferase involved in cell wall biosynthesis
VNILFANYGDCTSNSLNHIGAFANQLTRLGHACVVVIPDQPETVASLPAPLFPVRTFDRVLIEGAGFPNREAADVIHAWTPRENVRSFAMTYLAAHPTARLIIHLEDNEAHLAAAFAQRPINELAALSDVELAKILPANLAHPTRSWHFLQLAHGITHITESLADLMPPDQPRHLLLPGIDNALPAPENVAQLRAELVRAPDEKLIVYTGSTTFANLADVRALTLAVRQLNDTGHPTRLVRTGLNPPEYATTLDSIGGDHVTHLGFVSKARLPSLLAAADVLVQPGTIDDFNAYRLPSKLPEFLWSGRPTLAPSTNIGRQLTDGTNALLLHRSTPTEIAERCLEVFENPELAATLAAGARTFAQQHFDLTANTAGLLKFYSATAGLPTVFGDHPATADETAALVAKLDPQLGSRVRNLADTISQLRADLAETERVKSQHAAGERYTRAKLQAEKHVTENVRAELSQFAQTLAPTVAKLEQEATTLRELLAHNERIHTETVRHLESTQRQLESKLQRITQSGSWVFTAPFRALRRALFDPRPKSAPTPAAPSKAALPALAAPEDSGHRPIDPGLPHTLDEPLDWAAIPPNGRMRGWVIAIDQQEIVEVRILAGDKLIPTEFGCPRADVASLHRDHPFAANPGFTADYELPAGWTGETVFEALTTDGQWRRFAARATNVAVNSPDSLRRDYRAWVQRYDTLKLADAINARARIEALDLTQRPLISIIMPVYNAPERWLIRAIESVREQYYPNWELCIADDASPAPHVARILADYAKRDARIKTVRRATNGHISAASNSALGLATGEFVALLDHDDELRPHALAEVVFALEANPPLEFLYSDEDKIDEAGIRSDPYFKPDWNPDLLLGQNYTCHFSVFRRDRITAIGGFREGFEGSQDWDLTLRATADLAPNKVRHIARVLYHWRAIPGSTAMTPEGKDDYPLEAARRALTDYIATHQVPANLVEVEGRHWRLQYRLPESLPRVSIIIPTHNGFEMLRTCLDSLRSITDYPNLEIIIVNHQSDDPTILKYFTVLQTEGVRVIDYEGVFNFSAINNFAAQHAQGTLLAFLNNDLEIIHADWLREMVGQALRPEIGAVGAMLYFPNDTIQHAGVILGIGGLNGTPSIAGHAFKDLPRGSEGQFNRLRLVQNYAAVTAACMVVRREIFEAVGGYDAKSLPVAFNDVDLCLRIRAAGYRNLWTPYAELYHHESASRGVEDSPDKIERFGREVKIMRDRWAHVLDHDPAYNPNLTKLYQDFTLATPPRV